MQHIQIHLQVSADSERKIPVTQSAVFVPGSLKIEVFWGGSILRKRAETSTLKSRSSFM